MSELLNYAKASPSAYVAMAGLEKTIRESGLDGTLVELIKMRASQINGCAFCLDMHSKDARTAGETEQRLYTLSAWRETPFFTEAERAVLAWTEATTLLSDGPVPESLYHDLRRHFSEKQIVDLTLVVIAINGWNRLAVPFRSTPGRYQPASEPK